jgi:predicted deacetylase
VRAEYVLRVDDVCATMAWDAFSSVVEPALGLGIRPILGVIPINHDRELTKFPRRDDAWDSLRALQDRGAEIAQHGCHHVYTTNGRGCVGPWDRSEFAGVPFDEQRRLIATGYAALAEQDLHPVAFMAPAHSFDGETLRALAVETDVRAITDGLTFFPFRQGEFVFVPQLTARPLPAPFGVQTVTVHANAMQPADIVSLVAFLQKRHDRFIPFSEACRRVPSHSVSRIDALAGRVTSRGIAALRRRRRSDS